MPATDPLLTDAALEALEQRVALLLSGISEPPWAWEWVAEKSNEWVVGQAWAADGTRLSGQIHDRDDMVETVIERREVGANESGHASAKDADFIAAAPELVGLLLNAIRALRAQSAGAQAGWDAATKALWELSDAVSPGRSNQKDHQWYVQEAIDHRQDAERLAEVEMARDFMRASRDEYADRVATLEAQLAEVTQRDRADWQPIETAPKGSWPDGPDDVRDPAYEPPPHIWLWSESGQCEGYFDAYYADGESGYDGGPPWVDQLTGERVAATHWMPLPASPPPPQETEPVTPTPPRPLRQVLEEIVEAYDAYRQRGVLPSPDAYQLMVGAIERGRASLDREEPARGDLLSRLQQLSAQWRERLQRTSAAAAGAYRECADELDALLASLPEPPPPAEVTQRDRADWQPIETAPRDGTVILGWCPDAYQGKGIAQPVLWDYAGWSALWALRVRPTHWMPLPHPPTSTPPPQEKKP